jgi:hypothetical protein
MPRKPANPGKTQGRMWTFADVLDAVPVGRTTLRGVITDLGFERGAGRRNYIFDDDQVEAIRGAIKCRSNSCRHEKAAPRITGYGGPNAASVLTKAQERIAARLQKPICDGDGPKSKVVSLAAHRNRPSPRPS